MSRRLSFIVGGTLVLALAVATATAEAATQSLPDPSPMTIQATDFTASKLVSQQRVNSHGIAEYAREYSGAKVGGRLIPSVSSVALVMPDLQTAQLSYGPLSTLLIKETAKAIATGFERHHHTLVVTVKVGAQQSLAAGDRAMLVPVTVTFSEKKPLKGLKNLPKPLRKLLGSTHLHIEYAFVRVDSAISFVAGVDTLAGGLRNALTTLATDAAAHMKAGLMPTGFATPTITVPASPVPGVTLTTASSTWAGSGTNESVTYAWERCDATGANCVAIPGAVSTTYTLAQADVGSTIRVEAIYTNVDGTATSPASTQTAVVAAG